MKKMLAAVAFLVAGGSVAGDVTPTNYFTGYKWVPHSFTNAGDTGLSTNDAYLCFPISALSGLTTNQAKASGTGDVRAIYASWMACLYGKYVAKTNPFTAISLTKDAGASINSTGTLTVLTWYRTEIQRNESGTLVSE